MDWKLPPVTLDSFGEHELVALEDRAAHILRMRSGMWDGERHSLAEIGEELDLDKERVRQIQIQGLSVIRKLREAQRHLRSEPAHVPFRWRLPRKVARRRATEGPG